MSGELHNEELDETNRGGAKRYIVIGGILLAGAAIWLGVMPRLSQDHELKAQSQQSADHVQKVEVVSARMESDGDIQLPGNIQSVSEAPIYARASGYIVKRYVDIGSRVKTGSCSPRSNRRRQG